MKWLRVEIWYVRAWCCIWIGNALKWLVYDDATVIGWYDRAVKYAHHSALIAEGKLT